MGTATRPQSLKERQRQEREELILRAAGELLRERGYQETSIDDIAARVGIAKGTVYLHFASKEDLFLALVERGLREALRTLEPIFSSADPPREKLRAVIGQVWGWMRWRAATPFGAIFQNPEFMVRLAEKHQALSALWDEPMRQMSDVLEEGKAAGEFDATVPTPVMLSVYWGLFTPHTYRRLVEEQGMPFDEVVEHLTRVFFKGIAAGGPSCPARAGGDDA